MSEDRHLTPNDVAKRWDVHRATVLRMFHDGILPGIPLSQGKKRTTVRFRLSAIETWERKRESVKQSGGAEVVSSGHSK